MSINNVIGWANFGIALGLITLAAVFFWQAHRRGTLWAGWRGPQSALFMLAIVPLCTGLVLGQIAVFRLSTIGYPFGPNDWGTMVLRLATMVIVLAKTVRVVQGRLLTPADRTRLSGGTGGAEP